MRGSQQGQQYAGHHVALVHAVGQRKNAQPVIGRKQQRREAALPHAVRRQVHQPQRDQQNVEKAQLFPGDAQQHDVVQRCPVAPQRRQPVKTVDSGVGVTCRCTGIFFQQLRQQIGQAKVRQAQRQRREQRQRRTAEAAQKRAEAVFFLHDGRQKTHGQHRPKQQRLGLNGQRHAVQHRRGQVASFFQQIKA